MEKDREMHGDSFRRYLFINQWVVSQQTEAL